MLIDQIPDKSMSSVWNFMGQIADKSLPWNLLSGEEQGKMDMY